MDYLIFLTGLFLLVAAMGCALLYRRGRSGTGCICLAAAIVVLGFKCWAKILVFSYDLESMSSLFRSVTGATFSTLLLAFLLAESPNSKKCGLVGNISNISAGLVWMVLLIIGIWLPSGEEICLFAMIPAAAVSGWRASFLLRKREETKSYASGGVMLLLLLPTLTCMLPSSVEMCYDVRALRFAPERIVILSLIALGALSSIGLCLVFWKPLFYSDSPPDSSSARRHRMIIFAIALAAIFTCGNGAWIVKWIKNQSDRQASKSILRTMEIAARGIDPSLVTAIRGNPSEIETPGYKQLREFLVQTRNAMPGTRFIYLSGIREGRLVFLVDAEPPTHVDTFSPPGEVVEAYPEGWIKEVAGASTFRGPEPDKWGAWFAASVPIRDSFGNIIALLGIDYPALDWQKKRAKSSIAGMIITFNFSLLVAIFAGFSIAARKTEAVLLRSRQEADRLALVAKRTDNAVIITDTAGNVEWINEGFTRMSGYSQEEVKGRFLPDLHQREDRNIEQRARMGEAIHAGRSIESLLIKSDRSGQPYMVESACQPLTERSGNLTGFMVIERDVTKSHQTARLLETAARLSTELLSSDIESTDWNYILGILGTALDVDRCRLFRIHPHPVLAGTAMSEIARWTSEAMTIPDQVPAPENLHFRESGFGRWLDELRGNRIVSGLVREFPTEEGSQLISNEILSIIVVPVFIGNELTGYATLEACREDRLWEHWKVQILKSVAANIGLRQVLDQEAQKLTIARDEARNAAESAQAADRAKSVFLATMSHEIRTPLNSIIGMASLLETETLTPEQNDIALTILRSGGFLLELVSDILDYSKVESGEIQLAEAPFELAALCHEAIDILRPNATAKDLDLSCLIAPGLPAFFVGDPTRIRQILINLASNAIKFTHEGFVTLAVDGLRNDGEDWKLSFRILDSGIGIDSENLPLLFSPFCQVDSSYTREFGGVGLGLAICDRLVKAMGGDISVTSAPGKGSTFVVTLSLTETEALPNAPFTHTSPTISGKSQGLRILVAEDNAMGCKVMAMLLKAVGIRAQFVRNGQHAVDAAASKPYDLIFLDLQMPVMDGLEACRRIRELKLDPRPVIVAMTANAFEENRSAAIAAGMDVYLTKPVDFKRLRELLKSISTPVHSSELCDESPLQTSGLAMKEEQATDDAHLASLIDVSKLEVFRTIGYTDYAGILDEMAREMPAYLDGVSDFIIQGNMKSLKSHLHAHKGVLSYFGCAALITRITELEKRPSIEPLEAAPVRAELQQLWDESYRAIQDWQTAN